MLTLQKLKDMNPGTVFGRGVVKNNPDGIFATASEEYKDKQILWVAKRGSFHDWWIQYHWAEKGQQHVLDHGDKLQDEDTIKRLIECDDDAYDMYNH